jgi:hypothetical protein
MASGAIVQFRPTIGMNFESITVDNTAGGVALTASKYRPTGSVQAETAFITTEDATIRYTYDGTAPTSSLGHKAAAGTTLVLKGQNQMETFRAIRTTGTNGVLMVTYERE